LFEHLAGLLSFRLGIPPHRAAPRKEDQASVPIRFAAALQAGPLHDGAMTIEPYF
jgi:hypothetical protein